jgi:hypothetical protein
MLLTLGSLVRFRSQGSNTRQSKIPDHLNSLPPSLSIIAGIAAPQGRLRSLLHFVPAPAHVLSMLDMRRASRR